MDIVPSMVAALSLSTRSVTRRLNPSAIDIRVNIDLKNAYRVVLTRALQGMVIFVPPKAKRDWTRNPVFYEGVCDYLPRMGVAERDPHLRGQTRLKDNGLFLRANAKRCTIGHCQEGLVVTPSIVGFAHSTCNPPCASIRIWHDVVFPDSKDSPTLLPQQRIGSTVSLLVHGKFCSPKTCVASGHPSMDWAFVPEAAINKYRKPLACKNKIRPHAADRRTAS